MTSTTSKDIIRSMIERAKAWAAALLGVPAHRGDRIGLTVTRSGAVKFDVTNYLNTDDGKKQLKDASELAARLNLSHNAE